MLSDAPKSAREQAAWLAIIDHCLFAQEFVEGMTEEGFVEDRRTFYAVTRCLEIVSEAARRLRGAQQARFPSTEWREIETMGNVFRHAYDSVAENRIWLMVHQKVPGLLTVAREAAAE